MPQRPPTHGQDLARIRNRAREATPERQLYDRAWAAYSQHFRREHPLCADPAGVHAAEGRIQPAEVVDHIRPHRGNRALFWDPANHQGLCKRCHDTKTATEDGGFGRA